MRHAARSAQGRSGHVAEGGDERVAATAADPGFPADPQTPGPGGPPEESVVDPERDQVAAALQAGPAGIGSTRVSRGDRMARSQRVLRGKYDL